MTFSADKTAPYDIDSKLVQESFQASETIKRLKQKSRLLTQEIRRTLGPVKHAPPGNDMVKKKAEIDAKLHRQIANRRNGLREKVRKRHFRNADTAILECQFGGAPPIMPSEGPMLAHSIRYNIAERGQIVRLTCGDQSCLIEKEKHMARVQATQARLKLCTRQEAPHRRQCHRGSQEELTPNGVDTRGSTSRIIDMPFEQPQTRSIPGPGSPRIKMEEEEPQSIAAQDLTQLFPLQCQHLERLVPCLLPRWLPTLRPN